MSKPNLAASTKVPLQFPVTLDGEAFKELTVRRSRVGDNLWAQKQGGDDFEKGIAMMARLCDVRPEVIHELDDLDAEAVQGAINSFRGR